jgi:PLP dependent protein
MPIADNIKRIATELEKKVKLVAVSKTQSVESIMEAYQCGLRIFGENKVQEMINKYEKLPKDIEWHLLGHLQTNKVKLIAPFVSLIHSVDSLRLLQVIDSEAKKVGRVIPCLLQVKIAKEETKFGLTENEVILILNDLTFVELKNILVVGLMGMASFTDNLEMVRNEFIKLKVFFQSLRQNYFYNNPSFSELSMGMSGDYRIAVQEGSTMVRIGTLLFGERIYS